LSHCPSFFEHDLHDGSLQDLQTGADWAFLQLVLPHDLHIGFLHFLQVFLQRSQSSLE
jgi:hypothetical protein